MRIPNYVISIYTAAALRRLERLNQITAEEKRELREIEKAQARFEAMDPARAADVLEGISGGVA